MTLSVDIKKDPRIELNIRRTLDGNIMIFDHEDIDIYLSLEQKKCVTFPKEKYSDNTYSTQDRFFRYMQKRGVILPDSVRGGNIHGSLEATFGEAKVPGIDAVQVCLFVINEYINRERPYFRSSRQFDDDMLDRLLYPDPDNSTDLGDVPQSDKKGSMYPGIRPYGFQYNYSLIREDESGD